MPLPQAIVIVVDRLGAGYLGPYGNTWVDTPQLNQLAWESILWETAVADCPTLAGFYRAVGWGRHAWSEWPVPPHGPHDRGSSDHDSLIARLSAAGVHTALVTDEPQWSEHPLAGAFRERVWVPQVETGEAAGTIEETQFAHTLAAALEVLDRAPAPYLLWLHLRGMSGPWDAPREFRESLADEEDPPPPDFVEPPDRRLPEDCDPDELLGITQAYAGQVLLLDSCLGMLLRSLGGAQADQALLVFTSPRGFPLGEHGGLGASGDGLHEEVLHVPLFVRQPDRRDASQRYQGPVQPADIYATLSQWFQPAVPPGNGQNDGLDLLALAAGQLPGRDCVASVWGEQRALRTPAWLLRQVGDDPPRLFAKPDDRWEVNEVANRCRDVVEQGLRTLAAYEQLARSNRLRELPRLPEELLRPSD